MTRANKLDSMVKLTHDGKTMLMPKSEYEKRLKDIISPSKAKSQRDLYGGVAAEMYDPDAPMPKSFTTRHSPCWKGSGTKNGKLITADVAINFLLGKGKERGGKQRLLDQY
jgi:hypothetical protein